ncbi:MAG: hypothetical protein WCU88_07145 [Elusimicrobiota bacterium]
MRISKAHFLLCVLLLQAPLFARAGVVVQSVAGSAGVAPLAPIASPGLLRLGSFVEAALPGLSMHSLPQDSVLMKSFFPDYGPTKPLPEAFSPVKAAVLLDRARKEEPSLKAAPGVGFLNSPPVSAQEVLLAVNSVLQDIPADKLKDMPAETLDQLAMLAFDQPGFPAQESLDPWRSLGGVVELSKARAQTLLSKPQGGWEWKTRLSNKEDWLASSLKRSVSHHLPKEARLVSADPAAAVKAANGIPLRPTVFRHYLEGEGYWNLQGIFSRMKQRLWNSTMPYVKLMLHQFLKDHAVTYKDFEGVFLTLPGVPPEKVGVPERTRYVDIRIPADLPLLEIEPGNIFLVPLPLRMRAEDHEHYQKQLGWGKIPWHDSEEDLWKSHADLPGPILPIPFEPVGAGNLSAKE